MNACRYTNVLKNLLQIAYDQKSRKPSPTLKRRTMYDVNNLFRDENENPRQKIKIEDQVQDEIDKFIALSTNVDKEGGFTVENLYNLYEEYTTKLHLDKLKKKTFTKHVNVTATKLNLTHKTFSNHVKLESNDGQSKIKYEKRPGYVGRCLKKIV